jgi:hypothetical protein
MNKHRSQIKAVGDKDGSYDKRRADSSAAGGQFGAPGTPFMAAQTPLHAPPTPYGTYSI